MADAGRHLPQGGQLAGLHGGVAGFPQNRLGALQRSNLPGQVGGALGDAVFQLGVHPAQFFTAALAVAQVGGIRPHHYCLPVLKRETHRQALLKAATSGSAKFFLGTDSAPHARHTKEAACGCAGMYTAHAALELYAEAFDSVGALDKLEAFASFNGPDFYRLPRNSGTVTLRRESWTVPATLAYLDDAPLVPLRAGETLAWKLQG
ncbi:MAG: amidohydrolase family protein [Rivihabitans pingtungensis]